MQTAQRFAAGLALFALVGAGCLDSESVAVPPQTVRLAHAGSYALPVGTQRPEIVISDAGDAYVAVMEPDQDPSESTSRTVHRVYRYDDADFSKTPTVFPVTSVSEEYGIPSDHRLLVADGALAVVYQSETEKDEVTSQSLMLATYAFDGTELFRRPIFADAGAGSGEDFADLSAAWHDGWLSVATGTGEGRTNVRVLNLDGSIMSTHTVAAGPEKEILSESGNSLRFDEDGSLVVISGNAPGRAGSLRFTRINSVWDVVGSTSLPSSGREESFPTGIASYDGLLLVGYLSRVGLDDAYAPFLKIVDTSGDVLDDVQVGTDGTHPTVAVSGNRVFVAWSASVVEDGQLVPQVQIEEYSL